jgi:hypothetical protein
MAEAVLLRPQEGHGMTAPFNIRVGEGWDVHQLVAGRKLILGGVEVPHTTGLLGHSDADVLLHAITDALLGGPGWATSAGISRTPTRSSAVPIRRCCWPRPRAACARRAGRSATSTAP